MVQKNVKYSAKKIKHSAQKMIECSVGKYEIKIIVYIQFPLQSATDLWGSLDPTLRICVIWDRTFKTEKTSFNLILTLNQLHLCMSN